MHRVPDHCSIKWNGANLELVVTASQQGLTAEQLREAVTWLFAQSSIEVHRNGGCIGGDAMLASVIALLDPKPRIILHRGDTPHKWSPLVEHVASEIVEPTGNIQRNHDMCDLARLSGQGYLLACPREFSEVLRSGTWATIRYGRDKVKLPTRVIWPDGTSTVWNGA